MSQKSPAKRGSGSGKGKAAAAASPGGGGAHVTRSHTSSVTPKLTIIDLIKYEHDVVRYNAAMFRKTEDPELRQLLAYELIREISMHGAKEEMVRARYEVKHYQKELLTSTAVARQGGMNWQQQQQRRRVANPKFLSWICSPVRS